jgi:hypothetical protein
VAGQCPLRVKNGLHAFEKGCLYYARKQTSVSAAAMSDPDLDPLAQCNGYRLLQRQTAGLRKPWRLLRTLFKRPAIPMELTDQSPQRFTSLLGFLSHIRFAFASARFLSSALIFSIRVIASGVRILRVEFTCAPSQKCFSAG